MTWICVCVCVYIYIYRCTYLNMYMLMYLLPFKVFLGTCIDAHSPLFVRAFEVFAGKGQRMGV